MAKCKGCEAEIVWIKTINGKNMPCNVEKNDGRYGERRNNRRSYTALGDVHECE